MRKLLLSTIAIIIYCGQLHAQSPLNFTFKSNLPYPGKSLANIWGYVDSLGNEYAIVGTTAGVSIVNVTNPTSPVEVFTVPGLSSSWREIKTSGKYAYVTTEATVSGLQIINLSNLPASITSKYYTGDGAINGLLTKAHALHIDAGYCYLYGSNLFSGAAVILNLSDPWNPVYTGNTSNGGLSSNYIHDGCVSNDTLWGAHVYGGFFSVFNLANKSAPVLMQTQSTPNTFTHNTWLSDNHRVLFTTDEVTNSYLAAFDVADINNISLLDKIQSTPGNGSIVHNTYIKNDYAVASYYTEGVIIVDAARPDNLIKVGHYDTSPAYSGNGYHGCWGVYPYLPSGNIIASDIENGLYVLTPNYVRGCYFEGTVIDTLTGVPIPGATVQVLSSSMNEVTNASGQFRTGTVNAGTYTVTVTKAGYVTKTITGVVLTNGVLTNLNIQLALPAINVSGKIQDVANIGIPNANIVFENNNGFTFNGTADSSGVYQVNEVYPGTYAVTIGKWKYKTICQSVVVNASTGSLDYILVKGYYDDFTFDFGWVKAGNAKKGKWVRAIPVGTTYINPNDANPDADANTDCSKWAYVTGNGGGAYNNDDVDSGFTNLISPVLDLKTGYADPVIRFKRWFFVQPNSNDTLIIKLQKGTASYILEQVTKTSVGNSSWLQRNYRVLDYVTPGKSMKVSFYVKDKRPEHAVEAGVDEFYVVENLPARDDVNLTSIIQSENDFVKSVYPNPFNDQLIVTLNNDELNILVVELTDVIGRIVLSKTITKGDDEFQLSLNKELQSGVYFLKVKSDEHVAMVKLVKK
ncbi:MAG: choice-of-anchor B family protein [Bacteroidia bacterium]